MTSSSGTSVMLEVACLVLMVNKIRSIDGPWTDHYGTHCYLVALMNCYEMDGREQ